MSGETVSFQERYHFRSDVFRAKKIKISRDLRGGPHEMGSRQPLAGAVDLGPRHVNREINFYDNAP
jgi:hypothetical protein